eukprot:Platyproteum_vivax@DN2912_c0_g1_i1.p1
MPSERSKQSVLDTQFRTQWYHKTVENSLITHLELWDNLECLKNEIRNEIAKYEQLRIKISSASKGEDVKKLSQTSLVGGRYLSDLDCLVSREFVDTDIENLIKNKGLSDLKEICHRLSSQNVAVTGYLQVLKRQLQILKSTNGSLQKVYDRLFPKHGSLSKRVICWLSSKYFNYLGNLDKWGFLTPSVSALSYFLMVVVVSVEK